MLAGDPIAGLGIAGDSLSDEYAVETYNYARNWDELLVDEAGVNLGPSGNYGEPRRTGYAYNWARAGADSNDLLAAGQHTQLAAQIDAGLVSHAVLAIGQNDFYPENEPYISIATQQWTPQQIQAYSDQVVSNIETALVELYNTNARLVMSNIADYGVAPLTRQFSTAEQRDRVSVVIDAINERLAMLADQYNVPLVDMNGVARFFFGSNQAPNASWPLGGVTITNTAGVGPTNAFVDDGIHPHTLVQAQIANLYLTAFNLQYETPVDLFTEAESLALEGLAYGGSDTLGLDFADYVLLPSNASPVLSGLPTSITYTAGAPPVSIAPAGVVTDADNLNFANGELTVAFSAAAEADDRLAIRHQGTGAGQIGVSGDQVLFGGVAIGSFSGGDAETPLAITLNAQANNASVQALLRNLTFQNLAATPPDGSRAITLQLTDGDGGSSDIEVVIANVGEPSGWHNADEPADVDRNGPVALPDLVAMVTFLREHGTTFDLPTDGTLSPPPFVDVNNDGKATLTDLIAVVQELRDRLFGDGEGERIGPWSGLLLDDDDSNPFSDL